MKDYNIVAKCGNYEPYATGFADGYAKCEQECKREYPFVLNVYISWINLYIKKAKKLGLTDDQIAKLLEFYRAPCSENDPMFLIYAHDSVESNLKEDMKTITEIHKEKIDETD